MTRFAPYAAVALIVSACAGEPAEPADPVEVAEPTPAPAPAPAPEPAPAPAPPDAADAEFAALAPEARHTFLMEKGEAVYTSGGSAGVACVTCHMAGGTGAPPAFPPLVGQKDHMGTCEEHAGLIINGLTGPLEVNGVSYNGVMPPQAVLTNLEIAAVTTFERNSWGNDYGDCSPEDAAAAR